MGIRDNTDTAEELKDIIIADVVLILAFSLTLIGGVFHLRSNFGLLPLLLPVVAVGVTLSFVLHELMHKFVAQHFGAIAGFRTSYNGLIITLLTGALGFLLGIVGATYIYASNFTRRQNGIVSLAGPLTNFVVFGGSLAIGVAMFGTAFFTNPPVQSYAYFAISFTLFISILLAFFNMLPIPPLDGSKVLAWNAPLYVFMMALIFVLMVYFTQIGLDNVVFMVIIALFFSMFYRNVI
ncbi:MAG: site-2 protease family protein [Candidatus Marsarchaeota archaeon]|jgi:Zn-dependent protease|nr:site-2 protease family protein [Candidatus Marsarchaeota archaeon]